MKIAACKVVSNNYISYAEILADSFKKVDQYDDFYILIVDEVNDIVKKI